MPSDPVLVLRKLVSGVGKRTGDRTQWVASPLGPTEIEKEGLKVWLTRSRLKVWLISRLEVWW